MDKVYTSCGVRMYTRTNLRMKLSDKLKVAEKGNSWTLFINNKGTIANAVHHNGIMLRLSGQGYLANCRKEYIINYFFNKLREIMR